MKICHYAVSAEAGIQVTNNLCLILYIAGLLVNSVLDIKCRKASITMMMPAAVSAAVLHAVREDYISALILLVVFVITASVVIFLPELNGGGDIIQILVTFFCMGFIKCMFILTTGAAAALLFSLLRFFYYKKHYDKKHNKKIKDTDLPFIPFILTGVLLTAAFGI